LANDPYRLPADPFVLSHDPCSPAADLVFRADDVCFLPRDLCVLTEARCRRAKVLFSLAEDLGQLFEGLLSFTDCGCRVSEVLCSPAMALRMLAKDLGQVSEDLVRRTTGLDQEAEDLVSLPKGLREEPKDLHQEPKDISSLAEDICPYSRVLLQELTILFRLNKVHSVFSQSGTSRSKGLSRVSTQLRLEFETLFVEPKRLCRKGAARCATNLVPPTYSRRLRSDFL
jgi:hypothetical protein